VGSLNYLTITQPDISFAVQQVSQFLQAPRQSHLAVVRRILRYLKGTSGRGLIFPADNSLQLTGYSDADWAGCMDTRRSVTGWCMFLGNALISWKNKKQDRISKSSTESEYRAMSLHVLKLCGSRVCYVNLVFLSTLLHLFMLITQVLFRLLLILCFMNAPNILKLIVTTFVKLLIIIFLHYLIFPPSIRQMISLQRPCLGVDINS